MIIIAFRMLARIPSNLPNKQNPSCKILSISQANTYTFFFSFGYWFISFENFAYASIVFVFILCIHALTYPAHIDNSFSFIAQQPNRMALTNWLNHCMWILIETHWRTDNLSNRHTHTYIHIAPYKTYTSLNSHICNS